MLSSNTHKEESKPNQYSRPELPKLLFSSEELEEKQIIERMDIIVNNLLKHKDVLDLVNKQLELNPITICFDNNDILKTREFDKNQIVISKKVDFPFELLLVFLNKFCDFANKRLQALNPGSYGPLEADIYAREVLKRKFDSYVECLSLMLVGIDKYDWPVLGARRYSFLETPKFVTEELSLHLAIMPWDLCGLAKSLYQDNGMTHFDCEVVRFLNYGSAIFENALKKTEQEAIEIEQKIKQKKSEMEEMEKQVSELVKMLEAKSSVMNKLNDENKKQCEEIKEEWDAIQKAINYIDRVKLNDFEVKIEWSKRDIEDRLRKIDPVKVELDLLRNEIKPLKEKISKIEGDLSRYDLLCMANRAEKLGWQIELEGLKRQLSHIKKMPSNYNKWEKPVVTAALLEPVSSRRYFVASHPPSLFKSESATGEQKENIQRVSTLKPL